MTRGETGKAKARRARLGDLSFQPRFAYGEQAQVAAVAGADDGTALGAGFVRFADAAIPWTVKYDEVVLVLEGELTVETGEGNFTLGPRDSVWLPEGTELVYRSASALVFYAIHPSDWADKQEEGEV